MNSRVAVVAVMWVALGTSSCGEEVGSCLVPEGQPYCFQDYSEDECHAASGNFYPDKTCEEIGYVKECPSEPGKYRLEIHGC